MSSNYYAEWVPPEQYRNPPQNPGMPMSQPPPSRVSEYAPSAARPQNFNLPPPSQVRPNPYVRPQQSQPNSKEHAPPQQYQMPNPNIRNQMFAPPVQSMPPAPQPPQLQPRPPLQTQPRQPLPPPQPPRQPPPTTFDPAIAVRNRVSEYDPGHSHGHARSNITEYKPSQPYPSSRAHEFNPTHDMKPTPYVMGSSGGGGRSLAKPLLPTPVPSSEPKLEKPVYVPMADEWRKQKKEGSLMKASGAAPSAKIETADVLSAVLKHEGNAGNDRTIENILKSIGFDFELSRRTQEKAERERMRIEAMKRDRTDSRDFGITEGFGGGMSSFIGAELSDVNLKEVFAAQMKEKMRAEKSEEEDIGRRGPYNRGPEESVPQGFQQDISGFDAGRREQKPFNFSDYANKFHLDPSASGDRPRHAGFQHNETDDRCLEGGREVAKLEGHRYPSHREDPNYQMRGNLPEGKTQPPYYNMNTERKLERFDGASEHGQAVEDQRRVYRRNDGDNRQSHEELFRQERRPWSQQENQIQNHDRYQERNFSRVQDKGQEHSHERSQGYHNQDRNLERNLDRKEERNQERNNDRSLDRSYDQVQDFRSNQDRSYTRNQDRQYDRTEDRNQERNKEWNQSRAKDWNQDQSQGWNRDQIRSQGWNRDQDRSQDRHPDRSQDRSRDLERHPDRSQDRSRDQDRSQDRHPDRSQDRSRDQERHRDRSQDRSRDQERHPDRSQDRSRDQERHPDRSQDRSRDQERHRDRSRDRDQDRHHDRSRDQERYHDRSMDRNRDRGLDQSRDRSQDGSRSQDQRRHESRDSRDHHRESVHKRRLSPEHDELRSNASERSHRGSQSHSRQHSQTPSAKMPRLSGSRDSQKVVLDKKEEELLRQLYLQREERRLRLSSMESQLQTLQTNQNELLRKRNRAGPENDRLIKDSNRLQEEIRGAIEELKKTIDSNTKKIEHALSVSTQDNVDATKNEIEKYHDAGNHECLNCLVKTSSVTDHLNHLSSANHRKNVRLTMNQLWKPLKPQSSAKGPTVDMGPVQGAEFLMRTEGFFCDLCKVYIDDRTDGEQHLMSMEHNKMYQAFNLICPSYEKILELNRESVKIRLRQEESRLRKESETSADSSSKHATNNSNTAANNSKPAANNSKPAANNSKSASSSSKSASGSSKPAANDPKPATKAAHEAPRSQPSAPPATKPERTKDPSPPAPRPGLLPLSMLRRGPRAHLSQSSTKPSPPSAAKDHTGAGRSTDGGRGGGGTLTKPAKPGSVPATVVVKKPVDENIDMFS